MSIDSLHTVFFYYFKVCVNQKGTCYGGGDDKECFLARACAHPNYDCSCVMDTDYPCANYNINSQYECGTIVNDLPALLFFSALCAIILFVIMLAHCTTTATRSKSLHATQQQVSVSVQHPTDVPQDSAPPGGTVMMVESVARQGPVSSNDKSTDDEEKMLEHTAAPWGW